MLKPTQLSVWCGVNCNMGITLHPSMGSTRQPKFHSLDQTLYQSFLPNSSHFLSFLQALTCHLPQLSLVSVLFKGSFFLSKLLFMDFCLFSSIITNNTVNSNHLLFGAGADSWDGGSEVRILIWRLRKVLTGPIYNKIILESPAY